MEWVTDDIKKDINEIIRKNYCSEEEAQWLRDIMNNLSFTDIQVDGVYGEGGLPGYPAHCECKDRNGKVWRADFRVLEELPDDLWGVPEARASHREDRTIITPEEEAMLPFHRISSEQPTVAHPRTYPGARVLSEEEKKAWSLEAPDPVQAVKSVLNQPDMTDTKFAASRTITVPKLKAYCALFGLPRTGNRRALVARVWEHFRSQPVAAPEPVAERGGDLEEDSQESDNDNLEAHEAVAAAVGGDGAEASGSDSEPDVGV